MLALALAKCAVLVALAASSKIRVHGQAANVCVCKLECICVLFNGRIMISLFPFLSSLVMRHQNSAWHETARNRKERLVTASIGFDLGRDQTFMACL